MLKRLHLSSSPTSATVITRSQVVSFCCTSPSLLQNCLCHSTTSSSRSSLPHEQQQQQQRSNHDQYHNHNHQQRQQRQKFVHLGGKYKRLNDVSLRYSKSQQQQQQQQQMMNADGSGEQDNSNNAPAPPTFQDELEHLRKLANQEIQETQNRQHSASGLAAKQHQQQQSNHNNNNNDNDENNNNDTSSSSSANKDVIINREISESIGFFASSGVLLLPNTTGRFKHDERKLAAKHSSIKRMKSAYKFDSNNNNKFSGNGTSNRIMIFGQETNALAMKCARALFPLYQQQQQQGNHDHHQQHQEDPLLIVVEKQLERLLHLNQQIHKQLLLPLLSTNSNTNIKKKNINDDNDEADKKTLLLLSLLIRSVDPFFSLLHTVPDCSLRRIVVNFPPPCSSDSESHRRIVNHHFLSLAHQKLALGGDVVVATDYRPLHRFHEEQVIVTEGKLSWKDANVPSVTRGSTQDGDDQEEEEAADQQLEDEEEEESYVRSSASFKHQKNKKSSKHSQSNNQKKNTSKDNNMIDLVSIPTIDEAPARIKFSLLQQQQQEQHQQNSHHHHHQQPFYIMRKVKDMDTPDHVVLQNSSHVNERRLRYGALKK